MIVVSVLLVPVCELNTSGQADVVSEASGVEGRQYSRMTERSGVVINFNSYPSVLPMSLYLGKYSPTSN